VSVPLEPAVDARVRELGSADLLVGIPSYDNARTIGHVVRAVSVGLAKHFPDMKAVIVNSDGGSRDGTPEVVASTGIGSPQRILARHPLGPVHKILTPYHGVPGKGSALRTIFAIAERLRARACAVVDSDLRSITPVWIELLLGPIVEHGFDYVAPLYLRHKYDGTITNSIVYPLTRSLYGREVRQPIGGEFGFSGRLASHYLSRPVWESDVARFGIDIWMTTTALADGFRVCESFLGAKIHDPKDPSADLTAMLVQVVASVFDLMETYHDRWAAVEKAEAVPLFGFPHGVGLEPVSVNVARMLVIFEQGVRDLCEVWAAVLGPVVLRDVAALAGAPEDAFRFPDPLWVKVVHDFAIAYRRRALPRDQLLRSLVPLYLGRTAAFVLATAACDAAEVEAAIGALADEFVRQKPDLRARWPERAGAKEA
jgi:glycosyltransferase involved in cell wall biosynthesis